MQRMNKGNEMMKKYGLKKTSPKRKASTRVTRDLPRGGTKPGPRPSRGIGSSSTSGMKKAPSRGQGRVQRRPDAVGRPSGPINRPRPRPRPITRPLPAGSVEPTRVPRPGVQGRPRPRPMPRRKPGMMQRPVNRRIGRMR